MAYKYQLGAATLSGSLTQEGMIKVNDDAGTTKAIVDNTGVISGSSHLESGGNLTIAGTVKFNGAADAALDVAADSLYFRDSDGTLKRDSFDDIMTAIAGSGLANASGVLSVDIDELSAGTTLDQTQDHFMYSDAGTEKKITFSDLQDSVFADVSGDATIAGGGALTIAGGAVETAMLADDAVTGAKIALFDDSLAATTTHFLIADGTDYSSFALSGDVTCTNAGVVTIANDAVEQAMIADDAVGADQLASNAVVTASIVDNAVTLAKMAGLTRGSIILGDSSGDPSALAKGGAATLLQSDGTDVSYVAMSGDATIAAGGALTIANDAIETAMLNDNIISGQTELAHADIADADEFMISDGGTLKRVGVDSLRDHYFGVVSGDATIADGGALTIANNAVEDGMVNDNVATGLAGVGLSAASGVMALDLNELTAETLASGDFLAFVDSTDNGTHKETVDDLATLFAGNGLAAASAVLSLDLNELSAAAVNVGADSIAIIDADDSNNTKKESIADLVAGMTGAGLSHASGVLSVTGNNVSLKADGNALVEGYNYFADASSNATVTMPASPAVGDVVTAKAGNLTSGATVIINKGSADHRIDGLEGIIIESPFGAVTMVYVVADHWKIV
jgi:hypothetical protein